MVAGEDVAGHDDTRASGVVRAVTTKWGAKAKEVAATLKAQHAAGREGDDSPAAPVWPTARQQLDALTHLFRTTPKDTGPHGGETTLDDDGRDTDGLDTAALDNAALDNDAEEVATALRGVDWSQVRAATTERTSDVSNTIRSLADRVDWAKVQPVAAQVSSALIAAVASGRIPVGGRLGPIVVRAITDQNHLGKRVAANLESSSDPVPPDFRGVIEATAREA